MFELCTSHPSDEAAWMGHPSLESALGGGELLADAGAGAGGDEDGAGEDERPADAGAGAESFVQYEDAEQGTDERLHVEQVAVRP